MQRIFLALPFAALFFFSPPDAFADSQCNGNQNCNDVTNNTTNNQGGTGGAGGTAVNAPVTVNTNTAKGGDASAGVAFSGNSNVKVDQDTYNLNVNNQKTHVSNKQGQFQGQDQDQHQKIDDSGNSSIDWNAPRNTAGAYAGSAAIASDSCGSSVGAGGQGPAFGFSFNFARDDETCELIKLSRTLREYGDPVSAIALLCQDERVYKARLAIGQPCPKVED